MSPLACPKCRQAVSDDALDAGPCPNCGYDDAMVIPGSPKGAWLIATLAVVGVGAATAVFLLVPRPELARQTPRQQAAALLPPSPPVPEPDNLALAPPPRSLPAGALSVPSN